METLQPCFLYCGNPLPLLHLWYHSLRYTTLSSSKYVAPTILQTFMSSLQVTLTLSKYFTHNSTTHQQYLLSAYFGLGPNNTKLSQKCIVFSWSYLREPLCSRSPSSSCTNQSVLPLTLTLSLTLTLTLTSLHYILYIVSFTICNYTMLYLYIVYLVVYQQMSNWLLENYRKLINLLGKTKYIIVKSN